MSTQIAIKEVPLLDLNAQYESHKKEIFKAFQEVFESKNFILGSQVMELERQIALYCQTQYAIGVSSGTDALLIALMALNIGPEDEVITTPFSFFATAGSIARVGAKPVFVDADPQTYNLNPKLIEKHITSRTKAIMPVHLFGQMADMDAIMAIAQKHKLYVIEDAAQAIGAEYKNKKGDRCRAGSVGDMGCFSFFPSKNLGCMGDGGIVTTNNAELAEKMRILRIHGSNPKYYHHIVGGNFRLDTLQAAVLLVKLPHLEEQHQKRRENAVYYNQSIQEKAILPYVQNGFRMIYNQYTIRHKKRDELERYLHAKKIGNAIYYPVPLHLQKCFAYLGYAEGDCPESEKAAKEVLSIPIYAELSLDQKQYIVDTLNAFE